ncbi:preprotein translocase subunit YajC [Paracrocinitomix mangrovi]|uniref:preprotein translocase subunit YajC n=1 Tax=Paracrocinitomix mangrovi TaxID=2862509 RepID=UPI001C8E207B|nr:preprotein translocase subunit YajC [Paracrocinitomix mangrovi]UKN02108.1 preprotein translocase subunit YajC [Paracrocinitomix mangrovi]
MNLLTILLQEGGGQEGAGGATTLLMYGAIILIMYFFMLRPQIKKSKEARKFRESLAVGDKVVTAGGIHGNVVEINEHTVVISTEGSGKLRIEKNSLNLNPDAQLQQAKR